MTKIDWNDDEGLFSLVRRELFTAVVGDIMTKLGYLHQFCRRGSNRCARIW